MLLWAQAASLCHRATVGAVRDTQGPPGRGQSHHRREDRCLKNNLFLKRKIPTFFIQLFSIRAEIIFILAILSKYIENFSLDI